MKIKGAYLFMFTIGLFMSNCKHEPIFELPPPLDLKSWINKTDTAWNGTVNISDSNQTIPSINTKAVSNFLVLSNGFDTAISVRLNFDNNNLKVEKIAFRIRKSLALSGNSFDKNSIENIYVETKTNIYSSSEITIDSISFKLNNDQISNQYVLSDFYISIKTTSVIQKNTRFKIETPKINVLKSYFYLFQKGKLVSTDKELLNVDLKGGNEFYPTPLIDYRPDIKSPNDFFFLTIPTSSLENNPNFDVRSYLKYSKKGKFFTPQSGTIDVKKFHFKNSINMEGRNWYFKDTALNTNILIIDSLKLQYFNMPF